MSILEKFNFSEVSRKSENTTPHMLMRRRLLNALDEQIQGANFEVAGKHFYRTVEKTVKNAETGETERRTVERPLRKMWWRSNDTVMLELRFANRVMKIGPGNSIVVGSSENLVSTLENLKQAVMNGELDDAMKATSDGRKRGHKTGKPVGETAATAVTVTKPASKVGK
ncbi:MAG: hypothetical protein WCJ64_18755 [Rhodospirillaceae bacterium]